MKAADLADVIRFFDPKEPLRERKLHFWFIQREGSPRQRLKTFLTVQTQPQKVLFVGHRGSGKSTELNKLAEELKDQFHVIGFNVLDITGRTNLEYEDLMLAMSTQVTRDCIRNQLVNRPLSEPVRRRWTELRDWWARVVAGLDFGTPAEEVEIGVELNTLLGKIEIGASQSSNTREAIKHQINQQMPELIRNLDWVIAQAQAATNRRLLLVVEGLDKVDLQSANDIFRDHAPTITAPQAGMIYSFPIALRHSDHYATIRQSFSGVHFFPNLTTRHADGTENRTGVGALAALVIARMEPELIEPEALNLLVTSNGGIPVWLVALVRMAALYALERDENAAHISVADAMAAIKELRREGMAPLTRHDLSVLRERHHDRRLTNDPDEQRLLYNGSLIEYGEQWCDAHPALWYLLERDDDDDASVEPGS